MTVYVICFFVLSLIDAIVAKQLICGPINIADLFLCTVNIDFIDCKIGHSGPIFSFHYLVNS
jgi:hypothetical protein